MSLVVVDSGPTLLDRCAWAFGRRPRKLSEGAARELLIRGLPAMASVLSVWTRRGEGGYRFSVRVSVPGQLAYDARVRQRVRSQDLEWMQVGDVVGCRVDPGDRERVVLFVPAAPESGRKAAAKILADGRRAEATVLAVAPIAADYTGREDPVLRLDLELRAIDEPSPWRVRLIQPVPLSAIGQIDLGTRLTAAFVTVDRGASVAIDFASLTR
ncbi:hypothetical protein [Nocardia alba]|uniref:Uncharacterized protein n=1 Tax=Nocardia alba TaxID=225051 RepID=A0A4R1FLQ9_9NOCA|nr:hypothetical protein [Nocardia alba]TCJ94214.1 hypothetical protein DFR71_4811 [Nocardia alba]